MTVLINIQFLLQHIIEDFRLRFYTSEFKAELNNINKTI